MTDMVDFIQSILWVMADWFTVEPILYLFGLTCLLAICRAIRILLPY